MSPEAVFSVSLLSSGSFSSSDPVLSSELVSSVGASVESEDVFSWLTSVFNSSKIVYIIVAAQETKSRAAITIIIITTG